jgi:glycosyltransferase involved in cell wall biosynthesis
MNAGIDIAEVVLVCDEPVDNSAQLARQLAKEYPFIKVVELAANSGQHVATSAGILSSQGDWICTLDEDLQHPPEAMLELLCSLLRTSCDVAYAKSYQNTHAWSKSRDIFSRLAKKITTIMTGINFGQVSSFRMMRGPIARAAAACMDRSQYLDVNLFFLTSPQRRSQYNLALTDKRLQGDSGYTFRSLCKHFSKLLLSSSMGGTKAFILGILPLVFLVSLFALLFLIRALSTGIYAISPGWASMFTLEIVSLTILASVAAYLVKMLGIIGTRSIGLPPFMIVDRSADRFIYDRIVSSLGSDHE